MGELAVQAFTVRFCSHRISYHPEIPGSSSHRSI